MRMFGDDFSGSAYERFKGSLLRLWRVGFMIRKGEIEEGSQWRRFLNMSLNLIHSIQFSSRGRREDSTELHDLEASSKLVIRLSEPFAASIRDIPTTLTDVFSRVWSSLWPVPFTASSRLTVLLMGFWKFCSVTGGVSAESLRLLRTKFAASSRRPMMSCWQWGIWKV